MNISVRLALGFAALVSGAFAGTPIVSITSAQPFTLDGTSVSSPGVTSWPMILSDNVATKDGGALLKFKDGSTVSLSPKTQVRLTGTEQAPKLILVAGNLDYKLAAGSRLAIVTADKTVQDNENQQIAGTASSGDDVSSTAATSISPNHSVAIYYGATAVSLAGLGVATAALLQQNAASVQ